jgi:hypothetical protein
LYKEGKKLLFTLQQNEMVVLFNVHPDEIDWNSRVGLSRRLYRVMDFDIKGIIRLGMHNLSKVSSTLDPAPYSIRSKYSTIKAVKVIITNTGKITNCYD